jgi:predicted dehydrogenase
MEDPRAPNAPLAPDGTPAASGGDDGGSAVRVALVGAGYWGRNVARNLLDVPDTELLWVCDIDEIAAARLVGRRSEVRVTSELDKMLHDDEVEAVAVVTPPGTHLEIGLACLRAGKHVLMEKPLATSVADGRLLVRAAEEHGLTLMCDHTFCYTPHVRRIRELLHGGELGELQYIDSTRVNLGLVQSQIDVFWDLAPHDLSILDFILPPGLVPVQISAHSADPIKVGQACLGHLTMPLSNGALAHVHVNWLSPTKIRQMVIAGSRRMVLWNDLVPGRRLTIFDSGIDITETGGDERARRMVAYRLGDSVTPAIPESEALRAMVQEFADAVRAKRPAMTDGYAGLRVLQTLEAASMSRRANGALVNLELE